MSRCKDVASQLWSQLPTTCFKLKALERLTNRQQHCRSRLCRLIKGKPLNALKAKEWLARKLTMRDAWGTTLSVFVCIAVSFRVAEHIAASRSSAFSGFRLPATADSGHRVGRLGGT